MAKKKVQKRKRATLTGGRAVPSGRSTTDDLLASGEPLTFSNLPQGTYEGFIKEGSAVIVAKETGGDRAQLTLVVTAPAEFAEDKAEERRARTQTLFQDLTSQFGMNLLLGQLELMELPIPKTKKELGEVLAQTDDIPVRFWVGPPREENPPNVRINERLEGTPTASESATGDSGYYTRDEIMNASEKDLEDIIKTEELDIKPDDIETWEEVRELIITALGI